MTNFFPLNSLSLKHVAIIMDGNGRWALKRNLPRSAGHQAGGKSVKTVIEICAQKGIEVLTLFAFSSENWGRPADEVNYLMEMFLQTLKRESKKLKKNNVQLRFIGDRSRFNEKLQKKIIETEHATAQNSGLKLIIAANYSGRWDISEAARRIALHIKTEKLQPDEINAESFSKFLSLADLPEPDLLIRTGGEQRISNFMLWQFAYTEFYFSEKMWPDFDAEDFEKAFSTYNARQRRFGLIEEHVQSAKLENQNELSCVEEVA